VEHHPVYRCSTAAQEDKIVRVHPARGIVVTTEELLVRIADALPEAERGAFEEKMDELLNVQDPIMRTSEFRPVRISLLFSTGSRTRELHFEGGQWYLGEARRGRRGRPSKVNALPDDVEAVYQDYRGTFQGLRDVLRMHHEQSPSPTAAGPLTAEDAERHVREALGQPPETFLGFNVRRRGDLLWVAAQITRSGLLLTEEEIPWHSFVAGEFSPSALAEQTTAAVFGVSVKSLRRKLSRLKQAESSPTQ
jgi:hypothetical protein